jgi:cytoskeletal protein RodZ
MTSIGQQFAEERHRKNLTIEEVSKATKIRPEFLRAIEKGDFNKLPSATYAHGFVSNYAKFLGVPVEKSLAIFRREFDEKKSIEILPRGFVNTKEYRPNKFRIGRSTVLVGLIFLVVIAFLFYQYRSAIFNPNLNIQFPNEGAVINSLTFNVKGKTDPNATLIIDKKQVALNPDGSFNKQITVFPGPATISISVVNRFGRMTSIKRSIIVK